MYSMIYLVFASIYTPTLIFLSHCCFSFSCRKYTTFFLQLYTFWAFFSKKYRKGRQGVLFEELTPYYIY